MCGTFGFELDMCAIPPHGKDHLQQTESHIVKITHYADRAHTLKFMNMILSNYNTEKNQFKDLIACYRAFAPIIRTGDLYRLWDPFKVSTKCKLNYLA